MSAHTSRQQSSYTPDSDRPRAPRGSDPITVRMFLMFIIPLLTTFMVWFTSTIARNVVTVSRYEMDSLNTSRDIHDIAVSQARVDSGVKCLKAMMLKQSSAYCQ